ncbi:DgyrCDS9159 [Dimorphilus gyrociliatus]|uniref:DgyrCDS9159 n=1 Tax=Dimorphilus gyrociliatus TaxID=2664684 RepID=A0A7I8VXZ6_9ANNE|nr:DgyrCDS9159 [Dimorphilus gyrociliatus]
MLIVSLAETLKDTEDMKWFQSIALCVFISLHVCYGKIGFHEEMSMGFEGTSQDVKFGLIGAWDTHYGNQVQCILTCRDPNEVVSTIEPAEKPGSPNPDFSLSENFPWTVTLTPGSPVVTFTINYIQDNISDRPDCRENIYFHAACVRIVNNNEDQITVDPCDHISQVKDLAKMCDDPHIIQRVSGLNENGLETQENICYDLFGKAGDVFELITDEKLDVSVMCKLRDDFYIGAIRIHTPLGVIYATSEEISCLGHFKRSWKDVQRVTLGSDPSLLMELDKTLTVHVHGSSRKIAIQVQRTVQEYGKSYLNVLVSETSQPGQLLDQHHGGLFGFTANNKYEFMKPVQDDINAASVKVNGRVVKAFKKASMGTQNCYTLTLDDIVYPHTTAKFRKYF